MIARFMSFYKPGVTASSCRAGRGSGLPYGKVGHSGRWAGAERKRAVQEFAGGLVGAGCWAHAERKEVGHRVGVGLGGVRGIGLGFWVGSSFSISIPFQTQLFEFKLKFEFKPYALNKIKLMHQHECTNKLNLK